MSKIKVTYIDHMGTDLTVVRSARISFAKSSEILTEKDEKLIKYLAEHSHFTPFEHCQLTCIIEAPMPIRMHIMRHRTGKFNELSRRYTSADIEFYIPPIDDMRIQSKNNKQASEGTLDSLVAKNIHAEFDIHYQQMF
ncbi:MAG: FAD-dependent thymidylate synthase [Richelia sp. RM2_1_2]|nr:FAD-dependent thymidylate synthase [Richelia sp. RM2_1_2]